MGMKFGLERVRKLMAAAGDPQRSFRTIHVVGTNGKGSTTAILSAILSEMGMRVGRMTSPHLLNYRERIAVAGTWIPEESVIEYIDRYREEIERCQATFFEITTVMSAWYFRECGVDIVVAEAGLGGRLDATRLLGGDITVFTGVEIEHRRILGSTEAAIAAEKVAIAGEKTSLLAMKQSPDVESVIQDAVGRKELTRIIPDAASGSPLPGDHQKLNSGLAIHAAALASGSGMDRVLDAYWRVSENFKWAGRIDLRKGNPPILFDVAHSPGSMGHLIEHVRRGWKLPVTGVVGFLEDKFWREMTRQLRGVLDPVVTTTPLNERCLPANLLAEEFRKHGTEAVAEKDIGMALERGRELANENILVVTGSFFVTGEAMKHAWQEGLIEMPESGDEQDQLFHEGEHVDTPL
jgi:dihydrofolate synthase / folylpolyglutamate synthase